MNEQITVEIEIFLIMKDDESDGSIYIYRVAHFNPSSRISRKSSPGEKNFSDKSCLVSKVP